MTRDQRDDVLAGLRARVDDAIVDLSRLRSSDPAARPAINAIKLTRHTLEWFREPGAADRAASDIT